MGLWTDCATELRGKGVTTPPVLAADAPKPLTFVKFRGPATDSINMRQQSLMDD